jgi:hypothetical protein
LLRPAVDSLGQSPPALDANDLMTLIGGDVMQPHVIRGTSNSWRCARDAEAFKDHASCFPVIMRHSD